jgi:hypothetical protein
MPAKCQRCSAICAALTDPRGAGWQEMTCVASCFDGEQTWLCPACADSLRTTAEPENRASLTEDVH